MFEDRTYENIMRECFETAPPGIDLRQGGIFYDAVASACYKISQFYADLKTAFDLVFLTTAVDEYLDRKGVEFQVFRNPATPARYAFAWEGTAEPGAGERFFTDGLYFTLKRDEDENSIFYTQLYLEAEALGVKSNNILPGTPAVPMRNLSGLTSAAFVALIEPGADTESDNDYRRRIQEKIAGPAENGNRQHYKTWCEAVAGCGRARIIPLFAGENTVMGVIISPEGLPAAQTVVDRVQEYVDPMTLGLTVIVNGEVIPVGDGLGDGKANIGAHFAAVAPTPVPINVSCAVELRAGATLDQILADATQALTQYLKNLALTTPEKQEIVVRMSDIGSLLHALPGLIDYTGLTLNGTTMNIVLTDQQLAMFGEVSVSANI